MICIKCMQPVDSLYTVYSNDHIQLTDCPFCQEIVDKYVEIDNVLLFIDLLLLKPGAYRHLVFNSLELHLAKYPKGKTLKNCRSLYDHVQVLIFNVKNWFCKFDRLNRLWLLLLSFEIYLTWVTEESKYIYYMNRNNNDGKLISFQKTYQKPLNGTQLQCVTRSQVKCLPGAHRCSTFTLRVIVSLMFRYFTHLHGASY